MDNWVDFRVIKETVSMRMILDHYNINWLRKSGKEFRGQCPIHHQSEGAPTSGKKGSASFQVNADKNAFNCFSCKAHGNVLDFVAAMEQCTVRDAALKLAEWFSIGSGPEPKAKTQTASQLAREEVVERGEDAAENPPLNFQLKSVDPAHTYLRERGISLETTEKFGAGFFSGKGSMSGRVVIPIHNERGELVAYAGRAIDASEPRYKLPAGFHKSLELFNLHRALAFNDRVVIVVEGFFDCMRVHQSGYPSVALMGCSMSEQQEILLRRHFTGAVLLLDGDEAGRSATDACLRRLGRGWWVKAVMLPDGIQPDSLEPEHIEGLLDGS